MDGMRGPLDAKLQLVLGVPRHQPLHSATAHYD
jgi:hypothetical protein